VRSPIITVVIPTRNASAVLGPCLDSLARQTVPVHTVVVDCGSTDGTAALARREQATVIEMEQPPGPGPYFSHQRNAGARATSADILVFVDADMRLQPGLLEEAMDRIADGAVGVVLTEVTVGAGYWARVRAFERSFYVGNASVEAARVFRRDVFESVGGYDEELTAREDADLSRRIGRVGHLARTCNLVEHDETGLSLRQIMRKRSGYAEGNLRFLRKHGMTAVAWNADREFVRRPWVLLRRPSLGIGVVVLKSAEVGTLGIAATRGAVRRTLAGAAGELPVSATAAARAPVQPPRHVDATPRQQRVLMITFGSIVEPHGGLQVRSRVLAEALTEIGHRPAIVSTREAAGGPRTLPWARRLEWPAEKPRFGFSLAFARLIRAEARDSDLLIVANAMFMPALALSGVRLPMVWDTNECQTLHYDRLERTGANRAKRVIWWGLERWAAGRCRVAVAISTSEASEWRRIHPVLRDRVVTVNHTPFASQRSAEASRAKLAQLVGGPLGGPVLVFVGTMTAKHNAAAGRWIVDVLGPSLPETTTIVICGPGSELLQPRGRGARLACLGSVEDIDSVIAAADLCLAPLASGAGVKTKVLHYLAHGRRVAGTPVAFEGLEGAPGVFEAPMDSLATLVARLATQTETAETAETRAAAQREWIQCHHGREQVAAQWNGVLNAPAFI
jgi:Glycosyl transferase family 2/Glycosyl transferases group 1/Glycosyltransferase Family 4